MTQEIKHTALQKLLPLSAGQGNDAHLVFDAEGDEVFSSNYAGEENAEIVRACNSHDELVEALEEIAEGKGRYSTDPFQHAINTIDDMKELARKALAKARGQS